MKNSIKILFLMVILFGLSPNSWGMETEYFQEFDSISEESVIIENLPSSNIGQIRAKDGFINSKIEARFSIKANEPGEYDFLLSGTVNTQEGNANAIFKNSNKEYIILSNSNKLPGISAIADIKSSPSILSNPNAIAYPLSVVISPILLDDSFDEEGIHFITHNESPQDMEVSAALLPNAPHPNTYSIKNDEPGSYQAVITMSACRKP